MKSRILMGILALALLFPLTTSAKTFSNIMAYGDSLSDNGPDPYGAGRYTDGDIWLETLAVNMGATLFDTAIGGATTGEDNPAAGSSTQFGMQWQLDSTLSHFSSNFDLHDSLFTVWGGANDFFQGRDFSLAVNNLGTILKDLVQAGVSDVMIANLPDLGYSPAFYNDFGPVPQALASGWTLGFNTTLEQMLTQFRADNPDVTLYYLDVFSLFHQQVQKDATGEIINTSEWQALFWDDVHPTSIGHNLIAEKAYNLIDSPVPEPTSMLLFATGLAGLGAMRRKNREVRGH